MGKRNEWVSASDIGSLVFCARQHWLGKVKGVRPPKQKGPDRLTAGTRHHHTHGVKYDWQLRFRKASLILLGVAVVIGLFAALVMGVGR